MNLVWETIYYNEVLGVHGNPITTISLYLCTQNDNVMQVCLNTFIIITIYMKIEKLMRRQN